MIPHNIEIGGIKINIKFIPLGKNGNNYGMYYGNESRITIANELSQGQKQSTFIHETIEAINHIYSIGLKHEQIEKLEIALSSSHLIF